MCQRYDIKWPRHEELLYKEKEVCCIHQWITLNRPDVSELNQCESFCLIAFIESVLRCETVCSVLFIFSIDSSFFLDHGLLVPNTILQESLLCVQPTHMNSLSNQPRAISPQLDASLSRGCFSQVSGLNHVPSYPTVKVESAGVPSMKC